MDAFNKHSAMMSFLGTHYGININKRKKSAVAVNNKSQDHNEAIITFFGNSISGKRFIFIFR